MTLYKEIAFAVIAKDGTKLLACITKCKLNNVEWEDEFWSVLMTGPNYFWALNLVVGLTEGFESPKNPKAKVNEELRLATVTEVEKNVLVRFLAELPGAKPVEIQWVIEVCLYHRDFDTARKLTMAYIKGRYDTYYWCQLFKPTSIFKARLTDHTWVLPILVEYMLAMEQKDEYSPAELVNELVLEPLVKLEYLAKYSVASDTK